MSSLEPIHVLVVDSSEEQFVNTTVLLSDSHTPYEVSWVKTVQDALLILTTGKIDICLVNYQLPYNETAFDLLCNPSFKERKVPLLFIADQGDEYIAVKAMKSGAYDYLVKGRYDGSRLTHAIAEALKEHEYRIKMEAHHIEMIRLATTDELTGLYNRRHFMQRLDDELARYHRYNTPFSIAILDVDHFKTVNDSYGHHAGDHVLKEMGRLLRRSMRKTDAACRYGGEEFVIAFPNTDLDGAEIFGERLRRDVEHHLFNYDHNSIPVTVSVGIVEAYQEITTADTLLKLADKALYHAKRDGRNRVIVYRYGSGL